MKTGQLPGIKKKEKMKRLLFILISISIGLSSKAQQTQRLSKEERISHLSQTLSVDKTRAEEIAGALDYNVERLRITARDTSMEPQAKRTLMKQLHEERQAKIKSTLTPEQLSILQAKIAPLVEAQKAKVEARRLAQQKQIEEKRRLEGQGKKDIKKQ